MPIYRFTFQYNHTTVGASETFYTANVDSAVAASQIQALLDARQSMLFDTVTFAGVRIANVGDGSVQADKRRGRLWRPGKYDVKNHGMALTIWSTGDRAADVATQDYPVLARNALEVSLVYDTDRSVTRYLSGLPKAVVGGEPATFTPGKLPAWQTLYNAWVKVLTSGAYYIRARSRGGDFKPLDIVRWERLTAAPANATVSLVKATAPPLKEGDMVQVLSARRKGTDRLSYNGKYYVAAVNDTTDLRQVTLRGTEVMDPATVKKQGQLSKVGNEYFPVARVIPNLVGVHKRGKSYGGYRGSRKTRASVDP